MKRFFCLIFLFCSAASFAQQESVDSFHSEIVVDTSGIITVRESIAIYAAGDQFKRGIIRNLPLSRKDSLGKDIPVSYEVRQVLKDGLESPYFTEIKQNKLYIYVGEKSVFLNEGSHNYDIIYTTSGQIGFFQSFDELYWNVNGFGWNFAIKTVSASVQLPNNKVPNSSACYTGSYGSKTQNCSISTNAGKTIFEAGNMAQNENLSIALSFEKGLVKQPPPPGFLQRFGAQIMTFLFGLSLLLYYLLTWLKYGIDPPKPVVIPQFNPPDKLSPASLGMVYKGHFWQDLATASLVSLAVKGYLRIEDHTAKQLFGLIKDKSFKIHKLQEADSALPTEEAEILNRIFGSKTSQSFNGKYNATIKRALDNFQNKLTSQWNSLLFQGFNAKFWIFPILFSAAYLGLFIFWNQYFTNQSKFFYFGLFLAINAVLFLFYQWLIRRPAEDKLRLRSEIEGFKMYLSAAEDKQLQQFNPPNITPEIFEKYLPYALVLGVEDIWGDTFQKALKASSVSNSYNPIWYNQSISNIGRFGNMLSSSFSNTLSHSATQASSKSGGSWSSGSGGGGFSGGGGGGGGGGGW